MSVIIYEIEISIAKLIKKITLILRLTDEDNGAIYINSLCCANLAEASDL